MRNKLIEFLDLGYQPLANSFIKESNIKKKEKKYRLKICFNKKNYLVSIKNSFSSKVMFDHTYPYRSSMSKTVSKSFKDLSKKINKKFKPKKILEIGSNDGTFLKFFKKNKIIGVEPCKNIEKITKKKGYQTFPIYWNDKSSKFLKNKFGNFDIIFSANTLSHIKNLKNVFKNIYKILSTNGVLIIEDPSLLECLKSNTYDQFYNEHIYVFSTVALNEVLKENNLQIFRIEKIKLHGGSIRYYIKKKISNRKIEKSFYNQIFSETKFGLKKEKTYHQFAKRVKNSKNKLKNMFLKLKRKNYKIIGYGATAKSTTILNYCKIDFNFIDYFLDTTPDKQNKFTPGSKIKIFKYKNGINRDVDYTFLGAWNFKKEIFQKEKKYIKNGGKFIIHSPYPKIV